MFAFGTAVSDRRTYEEIALPGIRLASEPGSIVLERSGCDSIQRAYNEMIEEVAHLPHLEALVLLHQDLELLDESLPRRVREVFRADPSVGLMGSLGATLTKLHCWLEPDRMFGFLMGPGWSWGRPSKGPHEVDMVDGALLVLAPWAVRGLRFNEDLAEGFHGYDLDISCRVRAHGGKVICDDVHTYHQTYPKKDFQVRQAAGVRVARMWDPTIRPPEWEAAFQL